MNTSFDIYELNNAVMDAAKTIKDMRNDFTVDSKDAVVDLVTNADLKSEEILIKAITKYFPEDGIISEESDEVLSSNGRSWLMDPLDGTVNYANNIPQVALTLTLLINKVPVQTYVYDIFQENLYEGYSDKGAYKNSEKLQVTKDTSFQKAIIATGFPYDRLEFGEQYIQTFL
jgi:myo-inositol-1(or 4)-monophosphatase